MFFTWKIVPEIFVFIQFLTTDTTKFPAANFRFWSFIAIFMLAIFAFDMLMTIGISSSL